MDLIVAQPLLRAVLRAVLGEDLKLLRAESGAQVAAGVEFFLAACRGALPVEGP